MVLITYKNISDIVFPCFELPEGTLEIRDGLVFLNEKIVDDRNVDQKLLGLRRIQSPHRNILKLKRAVLDHLGLIKNPSGKRYIDKYGNLFIYKKTKLCDVIYHKIKRIEPKKSCSILWVHGVAHPFIIPRPPSYEYTWAGILYLNKRPWLLYDYASNKLDKYKRKV